MAGAFYIAKNSGDIPTNTLTSLSAVCYFHVTATGRSKTYIWWLFLKQKSPAIYKITNIWKNIFHIGSKVLVILYVSDYHKIFSLQLKASFKSSKDMIILNWF